MVLTVGGVGEDKEGPERQFLPWGDFLYVEKRVFDDGDGCEGAVRPTLMVKIGADGRLLLVDEFDDCLM